MAGLSSTLFAFRGILCAYLLSCALGVSASIGSPELFPEQSIVVLLAGLPGDSESENTYREQLQAWLDVLVGLAEPRAIIVLCDHPELLKLPLALEAKNMPSTRANFLGL